MGGDKSGTKDLSLDSQQNHKLKVKKLQFRRQLFFLSKIDPQKKRPKGKMPDFFRFNSKVALHQITFGSQLYNTCC